MTGMVHLIPVTTKVKITELADLYLREIVRLHGFPSSIVSNRDTKFTAAFGQELHRLAETKPLMSTSFHPQTDGLSEQMVKFVTQILQTMVELNQTDWHR